MRWVPYPVQIPHRCLFMPSVNGADGEGYVEGDEVDGLRAYISVEAVKQIALQMGWAPAAKASDGRLERLRGRIKDLEAENEDLVTRLEAVQVLKNAGFEQTRPPGRPRKQSVA
jgi:hypothetical protein